MNKKEGFGRGLNPVPGYSASPSTPRPSAVGAPSPFGSKGNDGKASGQTTPAPGTKKTFSAFSSKGGSSTGAASGSKFGSNAKPSAFSSSSSSAKSGSSFGKPGSSLGKSSFGGRFSKGAAGTGGGAVMSGAGRFNEELANKMYRLPEAVTAKTDDEGKDNEKTPQNVLDTHMEGELVDLVAKLQEHIHQQNYIYEAVRENLTKPKADDTSVTRQIRDLQQKLLMIDNKAIKSAEDIKTLKNKTEKESEFVLLLQQNGVHTLDGYDQSSTALVYRYYSGMVLDWEQKINGYQAQVTTLQRRLRPSELHAMHDEIEGLQVLLQEQQKSFVQLSARLHDMHAKIDDTCARVRPSINLQTVKQEVSTLYDNLSQGSQRSHPKRHLQADAAAAQPEMTAAAAGQQKKSPYGQRSSTFGSKTTSFGNKGSGGGFGGKTTSLGGKGGFGGNKGLPKSPTSPFASKSKNGEATPGASSTPFAKKSGGFGGKSLGAASGGGDLNKSIKPGGKTFGAFGKK
mmetsp:Transcript_15272/g.39279  ORF Transcript_15272/g.39279 Transcript_15272/m.39279 type:complete len:512 (-) Transcript_15272:334-1869(-)|eukprot:CAMPEP_0182921418 /NCGR_PEP_ID=MMETSP0105_2-20130417/4133_1 /TAXON_ID=81532 ORGANISM="Acanthoeca-like sp., Strain 10tr" /NCGR_SAMPLE_ID=MMETSP0105_2 /ASSEMBLY_ACC=CAM_ASM_000205 /LENGTH=511 /DNA_ID=CAMNT_0025058939 /DNA_START=38 /DNA_END=1573 /DNA_ORIENTATION=+